MKARSVGRLRFLASVLVIVAILFVVRLTYLQILNGKEFREEANRQYVSAGGESFDRGSLYFSKKDGTIISAATVRPSFFVSVNPMKIDDKDILWKKISPYLPNLKERDFLSHFKNQNDPYEVIAKDLDEETANKIIEKKISEVQIHKTAERVYPGKTLASQVLGFIGHDESSGDRELGQAGLERYYEGILSRKTQSLYVNFFAELFGDFSNVLFDRGSEKEGSVLLTIEPTVQAELEQVLGSVLKEYRGKEAGGIVLDPKTGALFAMGSLPDFDPNDPGKADPKTFKNPLVQSVFELGSIVKPLTMAAALDAGAVTPETKYKDEGKLEFGSMTIRNFDGKGRGSVSMQEVLNQSLNTGAVFAMQELGAERFQRYLRNYGFGDYTGIDLPGDTIGLTETIESGRPVELATDSFGQGFAVSPLAMARALASLGNGGLLMRPHVTKEISYSLGQKKTIEPVLERRVLDERTSTTITRMLVKVVDTALMHGTAKLDHYTVAAKTGTAQIPKQGGGYYEDRYLHSFFGYFPAYDPRFLVFLYISEPQGVQYASETLTKPFFDLTKFLLHYYEVPPDR